MKKFFIVSSIVIMIFAVNYCVNAQPSVSNKLTSAENDGKKITVPENDSKQPIKKDKLIVENGTTVSVHYTLIVDGKQEETSRDKEPIEFQIGAKQMIPGFEKAIIGMKIGEKKIFDVLPEEAYGNIDPKRLVDMPLEKLPPNIKPEVGMVLHVRGADGQPFPVKIKEVKEKSVVIDFNSPLAGKTLKFDVEIIGIK